MNFDEFKDYIGKLNKGEEVGVTIVSRGRFTAFSMTADEHRQYMKAKPEKYVGEITLFTKENRDEVIRTEYAKVKAARDERIKLRKSNVQASL